MILKEDLLRVLGNVKEDALYGKWSLEFTFDVLENMVAETLDMDNTDAYEAEDYNYICAFLEAMNLENETARRNVCALWISHCLRFGIKKSDELYKMELDALAGLVSKKEAESGFSWADFRSLVENCYN